MKNYLLSLSLPLLLIALQSNSIAMESQSSSSPNKNVSSSPQKGFYAVTGKLVQEQINLVARIEKAMLAADPNRMRVVRGQLFHQFKLVEGFLNRYRRNSGNQNCKSKIESKGDSFSSLLSASESQQQIYCGLYAYNQGLVKLVPVLDRLLSRRGESAMVRKLPLVSGERVFHPVLSLSSVQTPSLHKQAIPFATLEPRLVLPLHQTIGSQVKKSLANYNQPIQPAIAQPPETLAIFDIIKNNLNLAKNAFPSSHQFQDPRKTDAALNSFAYDIDPQEPQTYAKFLKIPSTGIFRVLHRRTFQRRLNHLQNRLGKDVIKSSTESISNISQGHLHRERLLFPTLNKSKSGFISILPLQLVNDVPSNPNSAYNFGILGKGIDYSFMIDVGDISLESLDGDLKNISPDVKNFILGYQPPTLLNDLQIDKRRFFTGKYSNQDNSLQISATAPAKLNHTYLARTFQFQLPDAIAFSGCKPIIACGEIISESQRRYLDQILEIQSSDIVIAFRPVRRRSDGSYTVLWRVVKQFENPIIRDLEKYIKY
ncbi:MAG: hypothetical protein AAF378_10285 [Cyanobacteria bacterium P01_A01_bin.84]